MTKADLVEAVYAKVGGVSKKDSREMVEIVFSAMKEMLSQGHKIKVAGFGNFMVRRKKERMGRNPQTGTPLLLEARNVLIFRTSDGLKERLNDSQ